MTEKPNFFYKEIKKQRIDLQKDFTKALLGDVPFDSPIQVRLNKIK